MLSMSSQDVFDVCQLDAETYANDTKDSTTAVSQKASCCTSVTPVMRAAQQHMQKTDTTQPRQTALQHHQFNSAHHTLAKQHSNCRAVHENMADLKAGGMHTICLSQPQHEHCRMQQGSDATAHGMCGCKRCCLHFLAVCLLPQWGSADKHLKTTPLPCAVSWAPSHIAA